MSAVGVFWDEVGKYDRRSFLWFVTGHHTMTRKLFVEGPHLVTID